MVYIIYKTDDRHRYASRDIIAVCTSLKQVIPMCKRQAKKEGKKIDEDQLWNLQHLKQTQGYSGPGEFHFEEMETNTLV